MNVYTYHPMEHITGLEVTAIQATDPKDYDKMPDQLKRHFIITVMPDPVVKVKPAMSEVMPAPKQKRRKH